jgi:hypothetical protein
MNKLNLINSIFTKKFNKILAFKEYNKHAKSARNVLEVSPIVITRKVKNNLNEACIAILVYRKLFAKQAIASNQRTSITYINEKVLYSRTNSFQYHEKFIQKKFPPLNKTSFYVWPAYPRTESTLLKYRFLRKFCIDHWSTIRLFVYCFRGIGFQN